MDRKEWYSTDTSGGQALVIEEGTGRNVAVAYEAADAPLLAEAPAMLAALQRAYQALAGDWERTREFDEIGAILSRIDGAPIAEPAAPSGEAGEVCASCGAEEGESHGAQCEARAFAAGAAIKRGEG